MILGRRWKAFKGPQRPWNTIERPLNALESSSRLRKTFWRPLGLARKVQSKTAMVQKRKVTNTGRWMTLVQNRYVSNMGRRITFHMFRWFLHSKAWLADIFFCCTLSTKPMYSIQSDWYSIHLFVYWLKIWRAENEESMTTHFEGHPMIQTKLNTYFRIFSLDHQVKLLEIAIASTEFFSLFSSRAVLKIQIKTLENIPKCPWNH